MDYTSVKEDKTMKKIKLDKSLPLENREKLDVGFKVFKLDSTNIKEWDTDTENLQQSLLDSIENIKRDGYVLIETLEGVEKIYPGEYLIRGLEGEYYPVKKINFEKVYDIIN